MHVHHVDRHSDFAAAKMAKNNLFESERMFCDVYCLEPGSRSGPAGPRPRDRAAAGGHPTRSTT